MLPSHSPMLSVFPARLAPLLVAVLIIAGGLAMQGHLMKHVPVFDTDGPRYLSVASDLAITGRFTDGEGDPEQAGHPSGMFNPPLYPALLAVVIKLSPPLAATASCYAEKRASCPETLGILVPLQFVIAGFNLLLLWRLAAVATESETVAWIALVLAAFGTYEFAAAALSPMTENLSLCLFTAWQLALVAAARRGSRGLALLAGLLLGLTALVRPAFLYIAYAGAVLCLLGWAVPMLRARYRVAIDLGTAIVAGAAIAVLPWLLRNAVEFGLFDLTSGYGGMILAQRIAYDPMNWNEYLAGWFFYLPDFGTSLARALFPPDWYARLGWGAGTFYDHGANVLAAQTAVEAGGADHQVGYLVRTYVLPEALKFAAVTPLLAWRGLWIGKYFSVVTFPFFVAALAIAPLRRRSGRLLLLSLPPLFMLFFLAVVSVDTIRYNIDLTASFAIGMALCIAMLYERVAGRPGGLVKSGLRPHI